MTPLSLVLVLATASAAEPLGAQVNLGISGTHEINDQVEIHGAGIYFWGPQPAPAEDMGIAFFYLGPKVTLGDHFSTAPHVGAVVNRNNDGQALPILSSWNWLAFGPIRGFVEAEIYTDFDSGEIAYYGLYSADYAGLGVVLLGLHVEQAGGTTIGPHVGVPLGKVLLQWDFHKSFNGDPDTLRFNLLLSG